MRWQVKAFTWIALLLAATSSAQAQGIEAPAARVYVTALSVLTDWGFPIQLAEKDAGLITTDELHIRLGKKLLDKGAGHWLNCGTYLGMSRAADASSVSFRLSVTVTGDSAVSQAKVKLTGSAYEKVGNEQTPCESRGRMEPIFLDSLRVRLSTTP